jgi:hypothetical protein
MTTKWLKIYQTNGDPITLVNATDEQIEAASSAVKEQHGFIQFMAGDNLNILAGRHIIRIEMGSATPLDLPAQVYIESL